MRIFTDAGRLVTSVEDQGIEILCLETFSWKFPTSGIYVKHKSDGFIELLVPLSLQQVKEIKANGGIENINDVIGDDYKPLPFPIYNNKPLFPYYLFSNKAPDEPITDVIDEVLDLTKVKIEYGSYDPDFNQFQYSSYITLQLFRKDGTVYMDDDERIKVKYFREGINRNDETIFSSYNESYPTNFDKEKQKYRFVLDPYYFYYHMVFTVNDVRIGKNAPLFDKNGNVWIDSYYYDFTLANDKPEPSNFVDVARAKISYSFDKNSKELYVEILLPSAKDGKPYVNMNNINCHLRLNWIENEGNDNISARSTQVFLMPDNKNEKYVFNSKMYLSGWNPNQTLVVIPFVNNVRMQGINPLDKYGELVIIKPKN